MRLLPHPTTPAGPVVTIDVTATRQPGDTLHLYYRLDADLAQLRLPMSRAPARADNLWQRTCFEVFISTPGSAGYAELNFSPSGEWAAYTFTSRRVGMRPAPLKSTPRAAWHRTDRRLDLQVEVNLDGLLPAPGDTGLRLAVAAVVEEESGTISYWALRHPAEQPDFHHADGFVLELPRNDPTDTRGAQDA